MAGVQVFEAEAGLFLCCIHAVLCCFDAVLMLFCPVLQVFGARLSAQPRHSDWEETVFQQVRTTLQTEQLKWTLFNYFFY